MVYSLKQIEEEWLRGISIHYSSEKIVKGFNTMGKYFTEEEIEEKIVHYRKDESTTLYVIESGLIISLIENLPKFRRLLRLIKDDFESGMMEALVSAYLTRNKTDLELYPQTNGGKADLRVKWDGKWIYIEITSLKVCPSPIPTRKAEEIINSFTFGQLTISFLKPPDSKDIGKIFDKIRQWSARKVPLQNQYQETIPGVCDLNFSPTDLPIARLGINTPYIDERFESIINREAKQLPENEMGIIIIDVSKVPNGIFKWSDNIQKGLEKIEKKERFGAIILLEKRFDSRYVVDLKIHKNPFGFSIPNDFLSLFYKIQ